LREFKGGAFNVLVATKAAEEGLDVADRDLVVFYEATASVIQFVQRQGRAGRRRDGEVAILLANSTADAVHAAVLDAKLARLPGIYYNVRRLKLGACKQNLGLAIRVRPGALFHKELVRELAVRGFDAVLDGSIASDVALPGGIGVRIITTADAECWDAEITAEELPGVERPVIAIWLQEEEINNLIDEIKHRHAGQDISVLSFADAVTLSIEIAEVLNKKYN